MAPGSNDPALIPVVNHHLLLSHGLAVKAYRALNLTGKIGISLNFQPVYCSEEEIQQEAIEADRIRNQIYLEPLLLGKSLASPNSSFVKLGDLDLISQPMDFLGVNYYARKVISSTSYQPEKTNSLGWETYPEGLYDILVNIKKEYPTVPTMIITENGFADEIDLPLGSASMIQDEDRINYIIDHLDAVLRAQKDNVPVIGYCVWTLKDDLEWSEGFKHKFGLVHMNRENQQLTPKASFYTYQKLIKNFQAKKASD